MVLDLMVFPLRNLVYERVKAAGHLEDKELIELLKKEGVVITLGNLNKALMHLEILNLITVRWVGKNKRRIEALKQDPEKPQASW